MSWILNCLKWDGSLLLSTLMGQSGAFRFDKLFFASSSCCSSPSRGPHEGRSQPEHDQLTFAIHLSPLGVFLFLLWAASHVFGRLSCRTSAVPSYTTTFRFAQCLYYLRSGVQYSFESQRHSIERDRQGVRRSLASYVVSRVGCQQSYGRDN